MKIWNKQYGNLTEATDPALFKIKLSCYGNEKSFTGCNIDHIYPKSLGGKDNINKEIFFNRKTIIDNKYKYIEPVRRII